MTPTRKIVVNFIQEHIRKRKLGAWDLSQISNNNNNTDDHDLADANNIAEILKSLQRIAAQLEAFINESHNERFGELTRLLVTRFLDNEDDEVDAELDFSSGYKELADELFLHGIQWNHIVTLLVFSAELVCKTIVEFRKKHIESREIHSMITPVINSICNYFNGNISDWVAQQDGGWMAIKAYEQGISSRQSNQHIKNNRGMRQYFGLAAFAVIIGGLYLCSRSNSL